MRIEHVQVETPNWDTKVRCSCGGNFGSRCEFFKHGYVETMADLNNTKWLINRMRVSFDELNEFFDPRTQPPKDFQEGDNEQGN